MNPSPIQHDPKEVVATALNEQGYLFHQKVLDTLLAPNAEGIYPHKWYIEAFEVPVSLPSGAETRIDILLRHGTSPGGAWRAVVECKRSSPNYKRWVFFGKTLRKNCSENLGIFEKADLGGVWDHQGPPPMTHQLDRREIGPNCPLFNFGVEALINPSGKPKRYSATDAIEDALRQVTLGQVGLARRLRATHVLRFRLLPVIVTTAELMSASFDDKHVSLDDGKIESANLHLETRPWLAVNYTVDDTISEQSTFTTNRSEDIATDMAERQMRTVFVVQAAHVQEFLVWLAASFKCDAEYK